MLALPAFFINLGLLPLFADESTRANVAMEMILSGNYSVPTIGGDYYYNKPPFYNWVLAALYNLTGNYSEFVTRLPAEIPLFLYTITIFLTVKHFLKDKRIALLSGMFFLLSGRILLYDSMLGHIDIFYSWLTYLSFVAIFYYYRKGQWFMLFFSSYLITAITFLCKGMPSIVFQGFTIITFLVSTQNFKKFISWQHIISGLICLSIIAAYFYNYSLHNPNLKEYFSTIWDQSSQRTAGRVGAGKTIKHILVFPFEHLWHLFPGSLMLLFAFHKRAILAIKQNAFLKYISLVLLVNIIVYWLSPETRPRYLLMLYPIVIIVGAYSYVSWKAELPLLNRVFNAIIIFIGAVLVFALPIAMMAGKLPPVSYSTAKVIFLTLVFIILTYLAFSIDNKIVPFMVMLIFVRLTFSWFVLPERAARHEGNYYKSACVEMAAISRNAPFYFYQYRPEVLSIPFHHRIIFYLERSRMAMVKFTEGDSKPGYYFTFDRDLQNPKAKLLKTYNGNLKLFKVQ